MSHDAPTPHPSPAGVLVSGILSELAQFGPLTASGMLLVAVWLIFRGSLVPRAYYDEMRADRDRWQEACEREEATSRELIAQNSALLDASLTTQRIVESLPPGEGA